MESVLKSKKLWKLLEVEVNDQTKDEDLAKMEEAKAILYVAMDREEIQKSGHCETVGDLWTKIKENHEGADVDQRAISHSEFLGLQYRKGEQIAAWCGRFELALARAEASGIEVDEATKFWVFRHTLPTDAAAVANFWLMANPDGKIQSLITAIKLQHHLDKHPRDDAAAALYSDGNKSAQHSKTCNYCKKLGHYASDCRKKASDESLQKNQGRSNQSSGSSSGHQQGNGSTGRNRTNANWNGRSNQNKQNKGKPNRGRKSAFNAIESDFTPSSNHWIIDSGCTSHMTSRRGIISDYKKLDTPRIITLGDGKQTLAKGKGKVVFECDGDEGELLDVLWVPEISENLFSVGKAMMNGNTVEFRGSEVLFRKSERVCLIGKKTQDDLFVVELTPVRSHGELAGATMEEWHERFNHSSLNSIKQLAKTGAVLGLKIDNSKDPCEDCVQGKLTRSSHPTRTTVRASETAAVIDIDTCGPIATPSLGGAKYFVLGVEQYSNYKLIDFAESKTEIPNIVKRIINKVELESKRLVKQIQTDNGSEFVNRKLQDFLQEKGILHERTSPYCPEQNGSVERANRTVLEGVRTLLSRSKLPDELWAEAANTVVYTTNRLLGPRSNEKTRYELYWRHKPDVSNLRNFGSAVYVHLPKQKQTNKLHSKADKGIFVGYTNRFNTYRTYFPDDKAIVISSDVKFTNKPLQRKKQVTVELVPISIGQAASPTNSEKVIAKPSTEQDGSQPTQIDDSEELDVDQNEVPSDHSVDESPELVSDNEHYETVLQESMEDEDTDESSLGNVTAVRDESEPIVERRATRSTTTRDELVKPSNVPSYWWDHEKANCAIALDNEPTTVKQAMESDDWPSWKAAMNEEIDALNKNKTWELVDRPSNKRLIKSKWVFKLKTKPDGSVDRYKARLVAKGYSQIPNVDYKETYAPVASATTIRILFALANQSSMELLQFDVKTAFLYGDLNETLFMEYPEGFDNPKNKVCHLRKSLYGLKQAPRQWNIKFNDLLTKFKLKRSSVDKCLYFNEQHSLILAIYVDDGLVASNDSKLLRAFVNHLQANFEVKTMKCEAFLGFRIKRYPEKRELIIHQTDYTLKVLERFGMSDCKPASTPEEVGSVIAANDEILPDTYPFKDLVGSLLYLVTCTRPDIAHAVSMASRTASPTMAHWLRLKRILRYLKGTTEIGIHYKGEQRPQLVGYSDADYANDTETRRSTTGLVIYYGNAPVFWRCQRQSIVTLSTTEAEYISGCELVKELLPIREMMLELKAIDESPTSVRIDNLSTVKIAKDDGGQKRTKHIDVRAKWLTEQVENNKIAVEHINGTDQPADILTKPLLKAKFQKNRNMLLMMLMLCNLMCIAMCKTLLKVEPIDFAPTGHIFLNKASTWSVEVVFPSLCPVLLGEPDSRNPIKVDCENEYNSMTNKLLKCTGPIAGLKARMHPKIVYPDRRFHVNLTRPYFLSPKGDTVAVLTEPLAGPIMTHEQRNANILKSIDEIKSHISSTVAALPSSANSTLMDALAKSMEGAGYNKQEWPEIAKKVEYYRRIHSEYSTVLSDMDTKLSEGILSGDFPIWHNNPIIMEATGKFARMFNCTKEVRQDSVVITLWFVVQRPDPEIEVFNTINFDFYNSTKSENGDRNITCWMMFQGPKYVMVNKTSSCITEVATKTLTDDSDITQFCQFEVNDLKPFASRLWRKEFCTSEIVPQKQRIQIKYLNGNTRVYCYPFNITIDNEKQSCPDYVFEIESTSHFRIADMELYGSPKVTEIDGSQQHFIRKLRTTLKVDEIQMGAKNLFTKIGSEVNEKALSISNMFSTGAQSISNFTTSVSTNIRNGARVIEDSITGNLKGFLEDLWSAIQYAGIALSIFIAGLLLVLAAPIIEAVFVGLKIVKVAYRTCTASAQRVLGRANYSAAKQTTKYLNRAKNSIGLSRFNNDHSRERYRRMA